MKEIGIFIFCIFCLIVTDVHIYALEFDDNQKLGTQLSIPFIKNQGQYDDRVKFFTTTQQQTLFVTESQLLHTFVMQANPEFGIDQNLDELKRGEESLDRSVVIREEFLNAQQFSPLGEEPAEMDVNYFVGHSDNWLKNLPSYNSVILGELWPGINVKLKESTNKIEKIFTIAPGSQIEDIKMTLSGINEMSLNSYGQLLLKTDLGEVLMSSPKAYQIINGRKVDVQAHYSVNEFTYGFEIGNYDVTAELFIDPLIGSFDLGGGTPFYADIDATGNVFLVGVAQNPLPNASSGTPIGNGDFYVVKFSSDLSSALAVTFVGGTGIEYSPQGAGPSIAVDLTDKIWITGATQSIDFPVSLSAPQQLNAGNGDVAVAKLSNDLNTIEGATYIGGSGEDWGDYITTDSNGNVFVVGHANIGFPFTAGKYDPTFNGDLTLGDAFAAKINSTITSVEATYLGGSAGEQAFHVETDSFGNIYITGFTSSSNYPTTTGSIFKGGISDFFISKLDNDLNTLIASTMLGSSGREIGTDLVLDADGNVFLTGQLSRSSTIITTPGVYQPVVGPNTNNGYIARFSNDLSVIQAATFVSSGSRSNTYNIGIGDCGSVYVNGNINVGLPNLQGFVYKFDKDLTRLKGDFILSGGTFSMTTNDIGEIYVVRSSVGTITKLSEDLSDIVINVPCRVIKESLGPAIVDFTVTAENINGQPIPVNCNPPSGVTFNSGETIVECTADDSVLNTITDSFIVDVQVPTPPETEINSAEDGNSIALVEGGTTFSDSITIAFTGTDNIGVAGFECSLDEGDFLSCTSPKSYFDLNSGDHVFEVRAVDTSGLEDPSPAFFHWRILTPQEIIMQIEADVQDLVDLGLINSGQSNSLISKLQGAISKLEQNPPQTNVAINKLNAFKNEVNAYINSGSLSPSEGQALIDKTNFVINLINQF